MFVQQVVREIQKLPYVNACSNPTKEQALKQLQKNRKIAIKPSNKCCCNAVMMDNVYYEEMSDPFVCNVL